MDFVSDNTAGAAPEILAAIAAANSGNAKSYGEDEWTARLTAAMSKLFEREVAVYLVLTGTAANALSIASLTPPWGAAICHAESHMAVDECGAPEFFSGGAKLVTIEGAGAKFTAAQLDQVLARFAHGGVHSVKPSVASITQASECGTVYTPGEISAIAKSAHASGMKLHMDGARLANALAHLNCAPADITWRAGVDILSFGLTKAGAFAAEAVVVFDKTIGGELAHRRKRGGHLLSKMRFVSAQFLAMIENGLWLKLAQQANAKAQRLAEGIRKTGKCEIVFPVEANEVFPRFPAQAVDALQAKGARFYVWDQAPKDGKVLVRLVTSFATTDAQIDEFLAVLVKL